MSRIALDISGMTCAACSSRVAKALSRVDGVEDAEVNLALERANIELKGEVTPEKLIEAVEKAGYGATLRSADEARQRKADEEREAARLAEERQTLLRFAVSALLSLALVVGTLPMMMGTGHAWIGPWTQAALAAGVMLASGTRFYREAFNAVRGGGANMAVLVSLGTSVAFFASLAEVIRGNAHAHLYFEAAAVVLTLVMLGKYLEARAKRGAGAALAALGKLQPAEAELVAADGTRTVPAETLRKGDVVLVRPGARFPSDGVILSGRSSVDEALVTGESLPVERGEGDPVLTGTINGEAALEVTVTRSAPTPGSPAWRGWSRRRRLATRRSSGWSTAFPRSSCRSSSSWPPRPSLSGGSRSAIRPAGLPRPSPCSSSPALARSGWRRRPRSSPEPVRPPAPAS